MQSLTRASTRAGLGTTFILAVLCAAALAQFALLDAAETRRFTVSADAVFKRNEWYRLVSSTLLHGGPLHFGMNALSTAAVGGALERSAGTVRLVALALWAAPLASLAACALAAAATYATGDPSYARQHALGFSGVVFALCVAEVGRSPNAKRSIFGVVEVPARLSPWALLLAMQLLVPNASFVGHLGGLATGSLEAGGYMTWLLPPAAGLDARLAGLPGYAVAGDENVRAASGLGDLLRFARHVVTFLAGLVGLDRCAAAARRRFGECWARAAEKPPELLAKAAVGATADV